MLYFVRVTRGLERVAAIELARLRDTHITEVAHRRLDFTLSGKPHPLLGLRSADDVYAYAGRLDRVAHTRDSLKQIEAFAASLDLEDALFACEQVRFIPPTSGYSITPSLRGRHNFSRFDAADAIAAGLERHANARGWRRVEADEDALTGDINVRAIIEDGYCLIGLRLAAAPLHRRDYLQATLPGALKPPVAYSLCLLAQPRRDDVMLDPLGGTGTTMIEAQTGLKVRRAITGDLHDEAIRVAQVNSEAAGVSLITMSADARFVPLPSESVDHIVSDLPWGRQVQVEGSLGDVYRDVLIEVERVIQEDGRAVLLTERTQEFMGALVDAPRLRLMIVRQISLYGSHPTIFLLQKDGDSAAELAQTPEWNAFIEEALEATKMHPDAAVRKALGL
jgi:tRNA (guanine6-N2)-methyltransferase